MSLSQKIAAALDENTKAYVLPCDVTVEDGPSRLTLHLTALDRSAWPSTRSSSPRPLARLDVRGAARPGATGCRAA